MKKSLNILVFLLICTLLTACQTGMGPEQLLQYNSNEGTGQFEDYDILDKGPVPGGTLNLFTTEPDTLNPLLTKNTYTADFLNFIYEGLTRLDKNQKAVPVLSDSWTVSPDGLIWDFHIRNGVRWQDGEAFTAYDAEFTIQTLQNNSIDSVYKPLLQNIVTCVAVDSSNIRIALAKPNSFLPEMMSFPIIPKHQFDVKDVLSSSKKFTPVGTGAYNYVSYTPEKNVIMKANKDWWQLSEANSASEDGTGENADGGGKLAGTLTDGGIAAADKGLYIETIQANIFKSPDDAMGAFQLGEIDVAGIPASDLSKYKGRTDLVIKKYTSRNYEFLAINTRNPVFSDQFARKAIDLAIDRDEIINDVLPGEAEASRLPILQESWISGTEGVKAVSAIPFPTSEYTTQAAIINSTTSSAIAAKTPSEALLAGGWKLGNDGYYKYIVGVRRYLKVSLLVNSNNSIRVRAAQKICAQLQRAGIPAEIKQVAWNDLMNSVTASKYDMAFIGCRIPQIPDLSYLYSLGYLPVSLAGAGGSAFNVSGYINPAVDANVASLFSETDDDRRKTILKALEDQLYNDTPYIGLYFLRDAMVYGKRLRGPLDPDTWNHFEGFTSWYKPETAY
ncbi:MAG TPA: peptide ABC transporter substrate-binding protein [Clostridia bacterium]|nr:peptide ABC transporter substrate-binding protein [Clostridia bacterium]